MKDEVRRLRNAVALQNSSITQGSMRIAVEDGLLVEAADGSGVALRVTGIEQVDGQLVITGTFTITGDADFTGQVNIDGPLGITGDATIGGTTQITGATTLKSDLTVQSPGRILTGGTIPVEINSNGEVKFGNAVLRGGAGGISMVDGTVPGRSVNVNSSGVTMQDVSALINITSALIQIAGAPLLISSTSVKMPNLPTTPGSPLGLPPGAVYQKPSTGEFFRCS